MPDDDQTQPPGDAQGKPKRWDTPTLAPEEDEAPSENAAAKLGRRTLRMILGHSAEREAKNDALIEKLLDKQMEDSAKSKKQMWALAVLLVLGLLASVGVASAIKWGGTEVSFGDGKSSTP